MLSHAACSLFLGFKQEITRAAEHTWYPPFSWASWALLPPEFLQAAGAEPAWTAAQGCSTAGDTSYNTTLKWKYSARCRWKKRGGEKKKIPHTTLTNFPVKPPSLSHPVEPEGHSLVLGLLPPQQHLLSSSALKKTPIFPQFKFFSCCPHLLPPLEPNTITLPV